MSLHVSGLRQEVEYMGRVKGPGTGKDLKRCLDKFSLDCESINRRQSTSVFNQVVGSF